MVDECIRNVGNIVAGAAGTVSTVVRSNIRDSSDLLRFTSKVSVVALHAKCVDEVTPESNELLTKLGLIGDIRSTLGVSHADRLLDPDLGLRLAIHSSF